MADSGVNSSLPAEPQERPKSLTPEVKAALKDFVTNVAQHSKKQSALVDVLVGAVKTLNQELQQEKLRSHLLEARLSKAEARMDQLVKVVDAMRRQGWVH